MIAGAIAAPRFRLDNEALVRAHVHALVLETMSLKGAEGLPSEPRLLVQVEQEGFPLSDDWRTVYQAGIERHFEEIVTAVEEAFTREMAAIRERGLPLPDEAQRTIYDGEVPLVIADFFFEAKIVVFVDGSPHHRGYVEQADRRKRMRLKGLGYRTVVVKAEEPEIGLDDLAAKVKT